MVKEKLVLVCGDASSITVNVAGGAPNCAATVLSVSSITTQLPRPCSRRPTAKGKVTVCRGCEGYPRAKGVLCIARVAAINVCGTARNCTGASPFLVHAQMYVVDG